MKTSKVQRFVFLLMVPALLLLWGCSRYHIAQAMKDYSHKPGFELEIINTDSISANDVHLGMIFKYLKGVKEIYILKFDSTKGSAAENRKLYMKLKKYVTAAHFDNLIDIESKNIVGLYLKKDDNGDVDQVIFIKSGGKHSLYVWAPDSRKTE